VQPPKKKRKRSTKKKAEAKSDEETEGSVRKEVKDFFEKVKERRKQEELEAKKMKVVRIDSRLSYMIRKQKRRRKPPLKMDYERSVDKSYAKKKQRGLPNSYIEQIPASTSGTATTDKNKEIPASTSGTAAPDKNEEIPASTSGTARNIKQIPASTTHQTDLFADITPEVQNTIDTMGDEELAQVISFYEQTKLPTGGLVVLEDLLADKNQEFRWRFELGKPLVKPELVNKLLTKMRIFHDGYLKKSAEGLEMFGMLVRPGDFSLQNEKVAWLRFADMYEIYHLDALNTDLMMAWCL
jgi:hypothetical protein